MGLPVALGWYSMRNNEERGTKDEKSRNIFVEERSEMGDETGTASKPHALDEEARRIKAGGSSWKHMGL